MSGNEEKISPKEQSLRNEIVEKSEEIIKLKEAITHLQTKEAILEKTQVQLEQLQAKIIMINQWADDFAANPDATYKGSFIGEELSKIMRKEKKNNENTS